MMIPRTSDSALAAVVFDWDGTLMDSIGYIVSCLQQAITEIGLDPRSPEQLREIVGLGLTQALAHLYPQVDPAVVTALTEAYRRYYFQTEATAMALFPDARPLLEQLQAQGMLLAVATGKSRRGLNLALEHSGLQGFFAVTVTADEYPSKPDPTMLQAALDHMGVAYPDALMVGDSVYDLEMAHNLGSLSVGVARGAYSAEHLAACQPVAVLPDLASLLGLVGSEK